MKKTVIFLLLISYAQAAEYKPTRIEQYFNQTLSALNEKKLFIENKIKSASSHISQAEKRAALARISQTSQYEAVVLTSTTALHELEATLQGINQQIRLLEDERVKSKTALIKNAESEEKYLRKTQLTHNIADLQNQIAQTQRLEQLLGSLSAHKSDNELKAFMRFSKNWQDKRNQLEIKLKNEQARLREIA